MTWDGDKLQFSSHDEIKEYMWKRLSDSSPTLPPVHEELGIEPEDVLIQYYRHGNLGDSQIREFWKAWSDIANASRKSSNDGVFRNAIALAEALPPPENPLLVTDFLSINPDDYDWLDDDDHDKQERILRLFHIWKIAPESDHLWTSAFDGYLDCIERNNVALNKEKKMPPLLAAYNGMGRLNERGLTRLFIAWSRNDSDLVQQQIAAIFEDQCVRFFSSEDRRSKDSFVEEIDEAFANAIVSYPKTLNTREMFHGLAIPGIDMASECVFREYNSTENPRYVVLSNQDQAKVA